MYIKYYRTLHHSFNQPYLDLSIFPFFFFIRIYLFASCFIRCFSFKRLYTFYTFYLLISFLFYSIFRLWPVFLRSLVSHSFSNSYASSFIRSYISMNNTYINSYFRARLSLVWAPRHLRVVLHLAQAIHLFLHSIMYLSSMIIDFVENWPKKSHNFKHFYMHTNKAFSLNCSIAFSSINNQAFQ